MCVCVCVPQKLLHSEVVAVEEITITSVGCRQEPGDWTDEMLLNHNRSPLLLTVTCMCFSGGLLWSYQEEDASDG